jgi:ubiquinone/menaquinone biosynthesis C-methylase UbiE
MQEVSIYYDQPVAREIGQTGAGLIWFLAKDHLSPSYSNEDCIALDSSRWREGASERVLNLAELQGIMWGDRVLDIGTGIGGPGRDVAKFMGADMFGLNLSFNQLRTLLGITSIANQCEGSNYCKVVNGDVQAIPFRSSFFDHALSVNMFYHVPYPKTAIAEISRVLNINGTFGLDDWFVTDSTTQETMTDLRHTWSTPAAGFHNYEEMKSVMESNGLHVENEIDYTAEATKFLTEERFGATFDSQLKDCLISLFPHLYQYDGYKEEHAVLAVNQLRSAIMGMGDLYRDGQAVYRQIVARKQ